MICPSSPASPLLALPGMGLCCRFQPQRSMDGAVGGRSPGSCHTNLSLTRHRPTSFARCGERRPPQAQARQVARLIAV